MCILNRGPRLADAANSQLAPGYAVYDTWSFHYENNGVNEDRYRYNGTASARRSE